MDTIFVFLALISLGVNLYQAHKEDRARSKMRSWLEFAKSIHAVSEQKQTGEISRFANSFITDLENELNQGKFWRWISFCLFIFAIGVLLGSLIIK